MIRSVLSAFCLPVVLLSTVSAVETAEFEVFHAGDGTTGPLAVGAGFSEDGERIVIVTEKFPPDEMAPAQEIESWLWVFDRSGRLIEKQVFNPGPWKGRLNIDPNLACRLWLRKDELVAEDGGTYLLENGEWRFKGYLSLPESGAEFDRVTMLGPVPGGGTLIAKNRKLFLATVEKSRDLGSVYVSGRAEPTPSLLPERDRADPVPVNPEVPDSFKVRLCQDGSVLAFQENWIRIGRSRIGPKGDRIKIQAPMYVVPASDIDINTKNDVAVVCADPPLGLWVRRGSVERTIPLPATPESVFWLPSGRILIEMTNGTPFLLLVDPETGRLSPPMSLPHEVDRLSVHQKTGDILGLFHEQKGWFLARESGESFDLERITGAHRSAPVTAVLPDAPRNRVFVMTEEGVIRILSVDGGKVTRRLHVPGPFGDRTQGHDVFNGKPQGELGGETSNNRWYSLAVSTDGKLILAGSDPGFLQGMLIDDPSVSFYHFLGGCRINGIAFLKKPEPDTYRVALYNRSFRTFVIDLILEQGAFRAKSVREIGANGGFSYDMAVASSDTRFGAIACSYWRGIRALDFESGIVRFIGEVPGPGHGVSAIPGTREMLGAYNTEDDHFAVVRFDPKDGNILWKKEGLEDMSYGAFAAGKDFWVSCDACRRLFVGRTDGSGDFRCIGMESYVEGECAQAIAFLPGGNKVLVGMADGRVLTLSLK